MTDVTQSDTSEEHPQTQRSQGLTSFALVSALLVVSVVVNIALARQVKALKHNIEIVKSEQKLQVGTQVPAIRGRSLEGAQEELSYNDVRIPTVLYVFTPQCIWCQRNLNNLRKLIESASDRYRVVGISLTRKELKEYLEREQLLFPVYTDVPDATRSVYKLGGTPTTIVVSPEGKVLKVWSGVYRDELRGEIEVYLNVHLPGCCTDSP